jgi:hypothetical protein
MLLDFAEMKQKTYILSKRTFIQFNHNMTESIANSLIALAKINRERKGPLDETGT